MARMYARLILIVVVAVVQQGAAQDVVKIGFNYPMSGPYAQEGLDQKRATDIAIGEINAMGGILGKQVVIVSRDSQSRDDVTRVNVRELIQQHGVKMVFGGSSSGVAAAAGEECQKLGVPFFGTLTYSSETTCEAGHRFVFRECFNATACARVLSAHLNRNFAGKKYMYITADYTWGRTTEAAIRSLTHTEDISIHRGIKTPFPGADEEDFKRALSLAQLIKPDVLVLVLFGEEMVVTARMATSRGLKSDMEVVVPNLTLAMAEAGGPKVMEGVVGAVSWHWRIPYLYDYSGGREFVEKFTARYDRYPSSSGASAYTILHEYTAAAERAQSIEGAAIVRALEGHAYQRLKDQQYWRDFDHQSIQTVYAVRCKPAEEVVRDKYKLDYFKIFAELGGEEAFRSREEWNAAREAAGLPPNLESLD